MKLALSLGFDEEKLMHSCTYASMACVYVCVCDADLIYMISQERYVGACIML